MAEVKCDNRPRETWLNAIWPVDCLDGMKKLPDHIVDFVFADLPYGTTQNTWDKLVPIEQMWTSFRRVCKPDAVMVFTAMQPFSSMLVCSNLHCFRYEMIWKKNKPRGFLNAKKQPLRTHESVLVFYEQQPMYQPQMSEGHKPMHAYTKHRPDGTNYGTTKRKVSGGGSTQRYPTSVLEIPVVNNDSTRVHPTQKPEALPAWFIRTYTKPGDVVFDPTCGSGSTLLAAVDLERQFLGFERDVTIAEKAQERLTARLRQR